MDQIEKEEQMKEYKRITRIVDEIKKAGGVNSTTFYEVLRRISRRTSETPHAIKDKEGNKCEDPAEIINVYKEWYKELLTTSKGITKEEKEVEEVVDIQWRCMQAIAKSKPTRITTAEEIDKVIKDLDPKKAKDAAGWKNIIMTEGGDEMRKSLRKICNEVDRQKQIPNEWMKMEILATHKKGDKELMSNKRGLFLTNNVSKVYERVIKRRNDTEFRQKINDTTMGGIKNRSTIDVLLLATSIIELNQYLNKHTYITLTDAEKCFDKLWLKDGVGELWRCGTDVRDCVMVKLLNEKAEVVVKTPVGNTESFILSDIVRQGTVYGPQICISSMDNVNGIGKRIVTSYGPEKQIGAAAFVDDVSGIGGIEVSNNTIYNCNIMEERKKMTFNNKNGKTEYMVVRGNNKEEIKTLTSKVKKGRVDRVKEHKLLGSWLDESGKYEINIMKRKEKLQFMLSTVRNKASSKTVGVMAVEARMNLAQTVVIQSILHNIEGFQSHTQEEVKKLESIQLTILTGILELPSSTPYHALLMETGWWTMKARLMYRKLMLYHNIMRSDEQRIIKTVIKIQKNEKRITTWYYSVEEAIKYYGITLLPENTLKSTWKRHVKKNINNKMKEEMRGLCKDKTKSRTVKNDEYIKKEYLGKASITDTKKILKARLHMTKVPGNYKQLGIVRCPLCDVSDISTEHYFKCHRCKQLLETWEVNEKDLRSQDLNKLRNLANFLEKVEGLLEPIINTRFDRMKKDAVKKKEEKQRNGKKL